MCPHQRVACGLFAELEILLLSVVKRFTQGQSFGYTRRPLESFVTIMINFMR